MVSSVLVPRRSRAKIWSLIVLLVLLVGVGSVSYLGWRQSVPGVASLTPPPRFVGQRTALVFTLEAARGSVARAEIRVAQGASSVVVAKREGALGRRVEIPVVLESATLGLREGGASVDVWARDDFWRPLRRHDRPVVPTERPPEIVPRPHVDARATLAEPERGALEHDGDLDPAPERALPFGDDHGAGALRDPDLGPRDAAAGGLEREHERRPLADEARRRGEGRDARHRLTPAEVRHGPDDAEQHEQDDQGPDLRAGPPRHENR